MDNERRPRAEGRLEYLEDRDRLRDSIRAIVERDSAFDSAGAVLARKDTVRWRLDITLINIEPSERAFRRIRSQLASYILRHDESPLVGIDFDEPAIALNGDEEGEATAPRLQNAEEVQALLRKVGGKVLGPRCHESSGFSGAAVLWVFVDWQGKVLHPALARPTGTNLDNAAVFVARRMEFKPATHNGSPLGVWVQQRVSFSC